MAALLINLTKNIKKGKVMKMPSQIQNSLPAVWDCSISFAVGKALRHAASTPNSLVQELFMNVC